MFLKLKVEMQSYFGCKVCRVCLSPEVVAPLTSIFGDNAEIAENFQAVTGIKVSFICFSQMPLMTL